MRRSESEAWLDLGYSAAALDRLNAMNAPAARPPRPPAPAVPPGAISFKAMAEQGYRQCGHCHAAPAELDVDGNCLRCGSTRLTWVPPIF